jgi:hypothetical protein
VSPFTINGLESRGFVGFVAFKHLVIADIPPQPGVYAVLGVNDAPPAFLAHSPAGHFKGKDPTVDVSLLESRWIAESGVIYIGKATNLATRLRQYRDFGEGKPIGHWGGRYIWQLEGADKHLLCWKPTEATPRQEEKALLAEFVIAYGRLPFANLSR